MIEPIKVETAVLLDLQYLPCIEYFCCISQFENVYLEACENYPKQTYRNRCDVLTTNKKDTLTVPVQHENRKVLYKDTRIDYSQNWIRRHWGCFQSAYGKSPFFEYYAPDLEAVYQKKPVFLFDLNRELLTVCLHFLRLNQSVRYTLSYSEIVDSKIFDARFLVNERKNAKNHFFYRSKPYYQTFGNDFVPNLSVIDLLFNQGPESIRVIRDSAARSLLENKSEQSH